MELRERIAALGETVAYQNLKDAVKQLAEDGSEENAEALGQKYNSFHKLFHAALKSHGKRLLASGQLASVEDVGPKAIQIYEEALEIALDALPVYFHLQDRVKEAKDSGPAE